MGGAQAATSAPLPCTRALRRAHLTSPSAARCRIKRPHSASSAASSSSRSASLPPPLLLPACGWPSCTQAYTCSTFWSSATMPAGRREARRHGMATCLPG